MFFRSIAVLGVSLLAGCQSPEARCLRLSWQVEVAERFVDPTADSVVSLPNRFSGHETWWVGDEVLAVESHGALPGGRRGDRKQWVVPRQGVVYSLDLQRGTFQAQPLARWDEERRRRARAAMIEMHQTIGEAAQSEAYRQYAGGLWLERGEGDHLLAALPGRLWALSGTTNRRLPWDERLLPLAFEDVSIDLAGPLGRVLARADPATIEMRPFTPGQTGVFVTLTLRKARWVENARALDDLPRSVVRRLAQRELELRDPELLWRYYDDPQERPDELDLRGIRVRLEMIVGAGDRVRVEERIEAANDLEELEELLHLLYVIDRGVFEDAYRRAVDTGDLALVLGAVSVRSLRSPAGLTREVDELLGARPTLWEGRAESDVREARGWLAGVRAWVGNLPGSSEPEPDPIAPPPDS